jgi:hypothetical protein
MKVEIRSGRNPVLALAGLAVALLLSSCATSRLTVSSTVGPKSFAAHSYGGKGYLMVYSEADEIHVGDGIPYYIHTSYNVATPDARIVKWVPNHLGDMDEAPQLVSLPSGNYQVVAKSTDYGQVRVPVLIQAGQTTRIHMEGNGSWKPQKPSISNNGLVRFSDGEPIGWRALAAK